jgi:hypothetical protein
MGGDRKKILFCPEKNELPRTVKKNAGILSRKVNNRPGKVKNSPLAFCIKVHHFQDFQVIGNMVLIRQWTALFKVHEMPAESSDVR